MYYTDYNHLEVIDAKYVEEADKICYWIRGCPIYWGYIHIYEDKIEVSKMCKLMRFSMDNPEDTIDQVVAWLIHICPMCLPADWVVENHGKYVSPTWYRKHKKIPVSGYLHKRANHFEDFLRGKTSTFNE